MSRKKNSVGTVPLTISTTPQINAYLERLVAKGFYGKNPADAAERVVSRTLEAMVKQGDLSEMNGHRKQRSKE
jgi:hypothetical protein